MGGWVGLTGTTTKKEERNGRDRVEWVGGWVGGLLFAFPLFGFYLCELLWEEEEEEEEENGNQDEEVGGWVGGWVFLLGCLLLLFLHSGFGF